MRARLGSATPPREELIARHVAGRSFVDVGCLWTIDGALCFAAEDAGAASVTGVDVMGPTERFQAELIRRRSSVRFVQGDLHDPAIVAAVGRHDVVWCSGVLYHAPHPLLTLERLRELTGRTLLLATETVAETPGRRNTCVIAPGTAEHPNAAPPVGPNAGYGPWYWGISRSALRSMLRLTGFTVVEEFRTPLHMTVVAR
ncbi:MAG: class I SAM-dependent methyltransferase [Solirubrobacteraceae bacterium]|nr:class I SAM-dependent methyltransferase [Solirubrobacteraceae bacterium]